MIEIVRATKTYGTTRVVDGVDLLIPRGGVTSVIGPNGAGKSTLLSIAGRLLEADGGTVHVDGMDVHTTRSDVLARRLATLRQDNHLTARLTVRDLVAFGRYPWSKGRPTPDDELHVCRALEFLELTDLAERYLDELSGGQRQRAFVAMVLCQDTDYVLLDEPLNNLDMRHQVAMMRLVRRTADELGRTVVMVLHDVNVAARYSDHLVAMRDGVVVHQGPPDRIVRTDVLRDVYDMHIPVHRVDGHPVAICTG
ncbi:iron ABC transporter ATP-binding protein [Cellulomonas bogoriensis]|uniref:Iron ABC transporter ATP-binding protein n=1 Tax=Cellulomonas bogoriensis 69B4 = DSM 16987 TaxID=1386082 RepID=A0A0A0C2E3_9CELL|nr:ATP-binding cassette domain-containing protein [Cellulomonas bogoriensis]KGM13554.1 iron ABC transporter ATP-binding protein [Cellulomonas bogoriensis 69B4 = DSM 16987]